MIEKAKKFHILFLEKDKMLVTVQLEMGIRQADWQSWPLRPERQRVLAGHSISMLK